MPIVRYIPDPSNPDRFTPEELARLDAMTDEELTANALSDPDNPPINERQERRIREIHAIRRVRAKTGLTQEEFAAAIGTSAEMVRAWERGPTIPDPVVQKLYRAIDRDPVATLRVLAAAE